MANKCALIIHGGAGNITNITKERRQAYIEGIQKCVVEGKRLLEQGAKSIDVVEACVNMLENNEVFNAGRGSVINSEGEVEMDASIMDGANLKAGSVIGLKHYKNPVSVARKVMDATEHVMLACEGAELFAQAVGFEYVENEYFKTEFRIKQAEEARRAGRTVLDVADIEKNKKLGTVGAVAYDQFGNIAAATSTGGIANKLKGRVGDTPLVGAGIYASNDFAGVSATGYGEQFIRSVLSFYAATQVNGKIKAPLACKRAMAYLRKSVNGLGGIIMIDKCGNIGKAATSDNLIHGYWQAGEEEYVSLTPSGKNLIN